MHTRVCLFVCLFVVGAWRKNFDLNRHHATRTNELLRLQAERCVTITRKHSSEVV
jgi:hypothetical protein